MSLGTNIYPKGQLNNVQQLLLRIYRIAETKRDAHWAIEQTDRPYTVCWYIHDGKKQIKINDTLYSVQKGDLVLFPSEIPFEIIKDATPLHHLEIAFDIKLGLYTPMSMFKFPIVTKIDDINETALIEDWQSFRVQWEQEIKMIYKDEQVIDSFHFQNTMKLVQFHTNILQWLEKLFDYMRPHSDIEAVMTDPRFLAVMHYIDDHISEKITLEMLANEMFVSKSHLIYLFKEMFGMPPMEYVRHVRIHKAKELLLSSQFSLHEIAKKIGFKNQSQFSRLFKQNAGVSPTIYRKNDSMF